MTPKEIEQLIRSGFDDGIVEVASTDNTHFEAVVVSADFEGVRPLARHQLVYKTLGALVGNEIHALSIRAFTPQELRDQQG
jgi:acid stress-induced BolA-like protein IbaG/YrbA